MISICAWCDKKIGEKEPLNDDRETHGMCNLCARIFQLDFVLRENLKNFCDYQGDMGFETLRIISNHVKSLNRIKKFRDEFSNQKNKIKFVEA